MADRYNKSKRRNELLIRYLKTALGMLILVAVISVVWLIAKPFVIRAERTTLDSVENATALEGIINEPEAADGSGDAGRSLIPAEMTVRFDTPGWQHDDNGWWYACDEDSYYVNGWFTLDGNDYHFDGRGYMDTGWTPIGGKGCYFDENGVYDKDADASNLIALTYDDGPGEYTAELLDALEENDAVATFFMLGEMVSQYGAETIPRMVQMGCTLGNHSYDHSNMTEIPLDDALEQFQKTDELIAQYSGGEAASVLRFPYGSYTDELEQKVGKPSIYWDHDSNDWKQTDDPAALAEQIEKNLAGGQIVLMHDIHGSSVQASKLLLPRLKELGYKAVSLEELAASRGYRLESGVTYFGFSAADIQAGHASSKDKEESSESE